MSISRDSSLFGNLTQISNVDCGVRTLNRLDEDRKFKRLRKLPKCRENAEGNGAGLHSCNWIHRASPTKMLVNFIVLTDLPLCKQSLSGCAYVSIFSSTPQKTPGKTISRYRTFSKHALVFLGDFDEVDCVFNHTHVGDSDCKSDGDDDDSCDETYT